MKKIYILIAIVVIVLIGLVIFWPSVSAMFFKGGSSSNPPVTQNPMACTEEAKLCPDGTSVVRTGPKCEFAACPNVKQDKTASINQRILNEDVYITPLKVTSDSRCPTNVLCVSAGNVTLSAKLEKLGETKTVDFNLTTPVNFAGKKIMLTDVVPSRTSVKTIPSSDYRFTFSVSSLDTTQKGTISGKVTTGPTCPVEHNPPDPACAPKPYETNIKIFNIDGDMLGGILVKTIKSKSDGSFTTSLAYGSYSLQAAGGETFPRCTPFILTLQKSSMSDISISCDTGIR